ncbi:MAG: di-trans,poly-cis-decaprenylcistransferase [Thaumarchaeota archaeon]|nr:di-trans,poly-cis-decaprenylcistransferase [Nitrososphaerota archaeon]
MNFLTLLKLIGAYKVYERVLKRQVEKGEMPGHIGIILDGNRRWASKHELPRFLGHELGADRVEDVLEWCHELGIKTITVYALSTENLMRDEEELNELFDLFEERLYALLKDPRLHNYRIRVKAMGKLERLPERIRVVLSKLEDVTKDYDGHFLNLAIAYGGRQEIVDGVREIAKEVKEGKVRPEDVDQELIERHLYTSHLPNPEPDLIIRTSGEERLSGFLLWQSAYSELVFLDVYWPEFRKIDLLRAIRTYQKRQRRFGR